jgi:hypothetical protein
MDMETKNSKFKTDFSEQKQRWSDNMRNLYMPSSAKSKIGLKDTTLPTSRLHLLSNTAVVVSTPHCVYSILHNVRHDVEPGQETDSCARVRERCLVFEADASVVYVAFVTFPKLCFYILTSSRLSWTWRTQ